MSDLPRYPDTTGKDVTKRIDELENYIINLHRFLRFALETIDETNMTTGARGQFLEIKGLYAELYADETGLLSRMSSAEGGVSTLQQNVNGLTSTVQGVEGNLSTLTQTVSGFSLDVTNGLTSSTIKLKSGEAEFSSQTISMNGLVKFTDLSTAGSTTINGSNITTGSITAVDINGVNIFGCTITGSNFSTTGQNSQIKLNGGKISIYSIGGIFFGSLSFSEMGYVSLASAARSDMVIYADNDLRIDARSGNTVAIGTAASATQSINIGNSNSTVNIKGTVSVSGSVDCQNLRNCFAEVLIGSTQTIATTARTKLNFNSSNYNHDPYGLFTVNSTGIKVNQSGIYSLYYYVDLGAVTGTGSGGVLWIGTNNDQQRYHRRLDGGNNADYADTKLMYMAAGEYVYISIQQGAATSNKYGAARSQAQIVLRPIKLD